MVEAKHHQISKAPKENYMGKDQPTGSTCQHPRRTPVEVKTTLSKTIFNGQRDSATPLTSFASTSI